MPRKRPTKAKRRADPLEQLCREVGKLQRIVRDVHDLAIGTAGKVGRLETEVAIVKARVTARPPKG